MSYPPPSDPSGYGQQPSYGGQGGYPQQGYGGGQREHPQGTTILVLGILSLVICGLLGPVAWIMGNNAIKEIDANPSGYSNRGSVQGGRICGMISSALLIIGVVIFVVLIIAGAASSSSN